jgi:acetyltransferase
MKSSLLPFLAPRGVVVVGVSTSPEKLGYGVARNLVGSGYPGSVHFVSQKAGELFGRPLHTDLAQVPDPVDLAVLVVPSLAMPVALQACGARGIHAAIVVSAGFREAGPEGAALEQECLELARQYHIRILGPNCIGTIDTHLPLDTTFLQPPIPTAGGIGFVSHSGAFCAAIVDWSRNQGFGFSQIISLGNQADVTETEMLPVVADDDHTLVIVLYMEGVSDGPGFVKTTREVAPRKPVIALKVGRFDSGQKAAASHTGALAASDTAFDAAFNKAGVLRADSAEQAFDWARALEVCPLPKGRRVAVLTDAGGPGVIATDSLELNRLQLADLSASTRAALAAQLAPAASVQNPVDMLASASPHQYAVCMNQLLKDPNVDSLLVILPPPPMFTAEAVAEAVIPLIRSSDKPVVVALMGSQLTAAAFELFSQARVATYPFPERAAGALGILARRADFLETAGLRAADSGRPIGVASAKPNATPYELLLAYGIPATAAKTAKSADEAAELSRELGYPVVMKIASPDILHKSDVGGVLLNINDDFQARSGYAQMLMAVRARLPGARIDGVNLQRQASGGQEVIIGATRDPTFGPLVMFGSGGVEAEGLKDVAFALAPLSASEARELMGRTWAGRRLDGYRNLPASDTAAALDAMIRLSWLAYEHPELKEIEINPLLVLPHGVLAVDIRATT